MIIQWKYFLFYFDVLFRLRCMKILSQVGNKYLSLTRSTIIIGVSFPIFSKAMLLECGTTHSKCLVSNQLKSQTLINLWERIQVLTQIYCRCNLHYYCSKVKIILVHTTGHPNNKVMTSYTIIEVWRGDVYEFYKSSLYAQKAKISEIQLSFFSNNQFWFWLNMSTKVPYRLQYQGENVDFPSK